MTASHGTPGIMFKELCSAHNMYYNVSRYFRPLKEWIGFIRPINGLMGIVGTIISGLIALGLNISHHVFVISVAAACVFLVTSGGNILNDLIDVDADRLNHPKRPLVTGSIKVSSAKVAFYVLFLAPIILSAAFLNVYATAIVFVAELLLVSYELKTKNLGLSGNITISILVGLIFVFGGIALNSPGRMLFLFLLAFLANLSREIIKDIQDMGGDVGRKTLPMSIGAKNASYIALGIVVAVVVISYLPFYLSIFSIYYLLVVIFSDAAFLASGYTALRDPGKGQQISKIGMILGLLSFAVGGLT